MWRSSFSVLAIALTGSALIVSSALLETIPAWNAFNLVAPICLAVASVITIWRLHLRAILSGAMILLITLVMLGSCGIVLVSRAYGPFAERVYAPGYASRTLYLYENPCFPPDGSWGCREYWTEIRTRVPFTPFTRVVVRCRCFYAEPTLTPAAIEFAVRHTYVDGTPSAIIDRRTLRPLDGSFQ